jgi:hypothetical protein
LSGKEGLYALLDHGVDWRSATGGYWFQFLEARRRFLKAILSRGEKANPDIKDPLHSVEMALKCSDTIAPGLLERYTLFWRQDLYTWQQRIAGVCQMPSLEAALEVLGLEQSTGGRVADVVRVTTPVAIEEPTTRPYALQELYDLLLADGKNANRAVSDHEMRGGRNRRASVLPHHGSPGVHEGGLLTSAWRAFRPGRGRGPTESNLALDVQTAADSV